MVRGSGTSYDTHVFSSICTVRHVPSEQIQLCMHVCYSNVQRSCHFIVHSRKLTLQTPSRLCRYAGTRIPMPSAALQSPKVPDTHTRTLAATRTSQIPSVEVLGSRCFCRKTSPCAWLAILARDAGPEHPTLLQSSGIQRVQVSHVACPPPTTMTTWNYLRTVAQLCWYSKTISRSSHGGHWTVLYRTVGPRLVALKQSRLT